MKIAIQVATATMGDIVIETSEEKNTTNVEQQKGVLVELLWDAIRKIKAVYQIEDGMLDLDDYETADERHQKHLAIPKPSTAEFNRQQREAPDSSVSSAYSSHSSSCPCQQGEQGALVDYEDTEEGEDMEITEDELEAAIILIRASRAAQEELDV